MLVMVLAFGMAITSCGNNNVQDYAGCGWDDCLVTRPCAARNCAGNQHNCNCFR